MSNSVKADSWFPRYLPAYTISGGSPAVVHCAVAASQTIYRGEPVTRAYTTGDITLATTSSAALFGIACEDVVTTSADEGTIIEVWVANDDTVFVGQCDAASSTAYPALLCDIVSSGSGTTKKWLVDIGTTTRSVLTVVDWVGGDDTSDSTDPGRVYFLIGKSQYTQRTTSQV
jgi:hypothetical protein